MIKTLNKQKAKEYMEKEFREIRAEHTTEYAEYRFYLFGDSRPTRNIAITAAILTGDGRLHIIISPGPVVVNGSALKWDMYRRALSYVQNELGQYFFTKIARSQDDLTLFRSDVKRLIERRHMLRMLTQFNWFLHRRVPTAQLGSRELETGMPDYFQWTEDCRGDLDGTAINIRRSFSYMYRPNPDEERMHAGNRLCYATFDIRLPCDTSQLNPGITLRGQYPLLIWPTADQMLSDNAEVVRAFYKMHGMPLTAKA